MFPENCSARSGNPREAVPGEPEPPEPTRGRYDNAELKSVARAVDPPGYERLLIAPRFRRLMVLILPELSSVLRAQGEIEPEAR
jgi:hypothetical protein